MTIACVLKSGGDYSPRWVGALARGILRYTPGARIVCLTDMQVVEPHIVAVPLGRDAFPGWWSKLTLLRPGLFPAGEPVVYLDLDTLPVADLSPLAEFTDPLILLSSFYRPQHRQSGVMLFRPGEVTERLWETWTKNPDAFMRRYRGDGEWLHAHAPAGPTVQALFPGVYSFKVHCKNGPPPDARLVAFHGRPRPNDPAAGWGHEAWRAA